MYDKTERMGRLIYVHGLALKVGADTNLAFQAAMLSKCDLSTGMVGEFPELQGIMGRYYALETPSAVGSGDERIAIANAIAEHYKPVGPNDTCPKAPISVALPIAYKIDSLVVFFAIGEKATGSRDPFALRRAALGVIRLILENQLRLPLNEVLRDAWMGATNVSGNDPTEEVLEFILDRLKVHLREQGIRHDLIAAASVRTTNIPEEIHFEDDLVRLMARVRALDTFLASDDGANLLIAYRRAANIVAIEEKRDRKKYDRPPFFDRLRQPEEIALDRAFRDVLTAPEFQGEDFTAAMSALASLRQPVDGFFDRVTVNTEEKVIVDGQERSLRENRLRLLSWIRNTMNRVADFSQIEG